MQIGFREIVFTLKSFAGAMLAMLIAFMLDLEKPSWAVLTAYIVAQPFAGMVQSKALYRVIGTLAGGAFAVVALGNLSSSSTLLALALALWLALCVYFSLLGRSARSYAFMLAGYTASIIAFPAVDTPGAIFDIAVARCEEIIIGITCAVIANQLVFPQQAGEALQRRIDIWIEDGARWITDVLRQKISGEIAFAGQAKLVADAIVVNGLQEHAVFDTPDLRNTRTWIYDLQRRMHSTMAVLGSIEDRLTRLRRDRPDLLSRHIGLFDRVADYVASPPSSIADRDRLLHEIDRATPTDLDVISDSNLLLMSTVVARLRDLIFFWDDCRDLRCKIAERKPAPTAAVPLAMHQDHLTAGLGAVAAAVAILLCNMFWVYTAWPSGAGAVIQAGVLCSIFAASDNPAELTVKFLNGTVIGTALAAIYVLFLLPSLNGFIPLVIASAIFYLPSGLLLASPRFGPSALPVILGFTSAVGIQNNYALAFDTFLNMVVASIFGIAAAVLVLRVFRSIGSDWLARRLLRAIRRDLARVSVADRLVDRASFESRMFDRLNTLLMRRRPDNPQITAIRGALAALRAGLNLFLLREAEPTLSPIARKAARQVRADLARLFRKRVADPGQLVRIDSSIDVTINNIALDEMTMMTKQAILALGSIRLLLQGHVDFFAEVPIALSEAQKGMAPI